MAAPNVTVNFEQWGFSPTTLSTYDITRENYGLMYELSLTGLANLIFAANANTIDLSVRQTKAAILAFQVAANPGPTNALWRRALEQATLLLGGSRFGQPFSASTRPYGRPFAIVLAETKAL